MLYHHLIYPYLRRALLHCVIFSLIFSPIIAAANEPLPIVADGTTNTIITHTASGIDQINIATPDSSGLSHNKFVDYNINESGQIINNFSGNVASEVVGGNGATAVTSTEIGGLVTVNQNLAHSGSATVILNEVTSTHNTELRGYAEIAGSNAELIIANPNGLTCSSCGFINTARMALIGGRSQFDENGHLSGFDLVAPSNADNTQQYIRSGDGGNGLIPVITISGLGLDVSNVSATEIIARSTQLISSIYGNSKSSVAVRTGDEFYDYNTKQVTSSAGAVDVNSNGANGGGDNSNPELFAIDASNLSSSIQAGTIFLVATKDGLGINSAGNVIAEDKVEISAKGDVNYHVVSANNSASVSSDGNISALNSDSNSAILVANQLTINALGDVNNSGLITARDSVNLTAKNLSNDGEISAVNSLVINVTNNLVNTRDILSKSELTLSTDSLLAGSLNNSGTIGATHSLNVSIDGNLTNSGTIYSLQNLTISKSLNLVNSGLIYAANNLDLTTDYAFTNLTSELLKQIKCLFLKVIV